MRYIFISLIHGVSLMILVTFMGGINPASAQSDKHISVGIGPFGYLDPITPSINFHGEAQVFNLFRMDVAYGLDVSKIALLRWHPNPEYRHHEMKVGLKRFLAPPYSSKNFVSYAGVEYFMVRNDYEKGNDQYRCNGEELLFDSAKVSRNVDGMRLKVGFQKVSKSFGIDIYFGAGVRYVAITYETTNERLAGNLWEIIGWFSPIDETARSRYRFDINLGFKLFYLLRGKRVE